MDYFSADKFAVQHLYHYEYIAYHDRLTFLTFCSIV